MKTILIFAIFLICLEISLRLGGNIYYTLQTTKLDSNGFRIIALGESTTQGGSGLGQKFAYPGQLEIALSRSCKRPVKVFNLGIAGVRTADILASLAGNLEKYRPNLVITMIGINDDENNFFDTTEEPSYFMHELKKSRLYKLSVWLKEIRRQIWPESGAEDRIAPGDDPDSILAKIKAGRTFDYNEFGTKFTEVLFGAGDTERAIRMHKEVLNVRPNHAWAKIGLGWIYRGLKKDHALAEQFYLSALATPQLDWTTTKWFKMRLAHYYLDLGRLNDSQALAADVLAMGKNSSFDYTYIADLYLQSQQWELAGELLERAKREYPYNQKISALLQYVYLRTRNQPLVQSEMQHYASLNSRIPLETYVNYRAIVEHLLERKIPLLAMQYPMRSDENLRNMLRDFLEKNPNLKILSNEQVFKEALKAHRYEDLFIDRFGGNFGHTTLRGDELIASNAAQALLTQFPALKSWCE